ncbi:helix-turn-helix domain-containing protein [Methanoculleus sp.]|uniref:helix-turn-helix domain-containing protein n=1 Tax=Methanoculleus sp. TaxID=90427 RepID=UPI00345D1B7B
MLRVTGRIRISGWGRIPRSCRNARPLARPPSSRDSVPRTKRLCDLLHILTLQRWRSGLRAEYTVNVLLKICAALNCDFTDITNVDRSKHKSKRGGGRHSERAQ